MHEQTPSNRRPLIEWEDERFALGVTPMDDNHRGFVSLLNRLYAADDHGFAALYGELVRHTEKHFQEEEALMLISGFPAIGEHVGEHRRILGEMVQIGRRIEKGLVAFGRAYTGERLPDWFRLHTLTMDSALAAHWKQYSESRA